MTLRAVHARPEAGRRRARPQGARRHRRARRRDLPPICRRRPRGVGGRLTTQPTTPAPPRAPLLQGRRPFCSRTQMTITSPHNAEAQGDPQAPPAPPLARASRALRRRGRGPARGRRRGRLGRRSSGTARPAAACRASRSSPELLATASGLGSGTRGARRSTSSAGRRRRPGRCASYLRGVHDPGNVGAVLRSRAGVRRLVASRSAPAPPTRSARRRCGAAWARSSRVPLARVDRRRRRCPGRRSRSSPARASRWRRSPRPLGAADVTLLVGAEREGLPDDVIAACDDVAHIPIADRVAERRDGGDDRALRDQLGWRRA